METIDFQNLWQQRQTETPNSAQIIAKASEFNKKLRSKMMLGNLLLAVTSVFVIGIVWFYDPQLWTTKLGVVLTVSAMAIFILYSTKLIRLAKPLPAAPDLHSGLSDMRELKRRQAFLQTKIMNVYFLLLSAGIFLYMIEYASRMTTTMAIICYGLTGAWFLFNWFYVRVKAIRKQREKIDEVLKSLDSIENQFESGNDL